MTTNYHTAISVGAAANAATFNSPLGQLDAAIGTTSLNPTGTTTGATVQAQTFTKGVAISSNLTFNPVTAPGAPTIGSITAGGSVDDGDHYYRITFINSFGETELGTVSAVATCGAGNNTVNLTNIPTSADTTVTQRKIYRGSDSSPYYRLLATLANNTTTTYTDTAANSTLPATGSQNTWNTTGGGIYVGTTLAGYVGYSNTYLGYGGFSALTTGFDNVGVGWSTLADVTTGINLVAIGVKALEHNTTGYSNTAVGVHVMQDELTGAWNTAMGVNAMRNHESGDYNTIIGGNALFLNETGSENTAVGSGALLSTTGSSNVAIGFQAGYYETGSNKLYIDNAPRASESDARTKALIYGVFDAATANQTLRINGKLGVCMAPSNQLDVTGSFIGLTPATGTSYAALNMQNNGVQFLVGIEASAGANLFSSTPAYACVVGTPNNRAVQLISNDIISLTIQNGSMGFFGHAVAAQPAKASHNNWAALSDVIAALVEIGIFDAA